ncbi:MAG TPA: hemerythrin domain-containing protein [Bryobacteraceae bacterium]|nr:hemerythrin domain-containing protein [Bryobacteraceae bacterium]
MDTNSRSTPETPGSGSLRAVMEHIVERHHTFCRNEVVRLSSLFGEVTAEWGKQHPELKRMGALFAAMAKDLHMHLIKEEQTLFPYIARLEEAVQRGTAVSWPPFGTVENPIRIMIEEHDQTDHELKEMRSLSGGYMFPPDAPASYAALYEGLRSFEREMEDHIRLENEELFPRAIAMEQDACARKTAGQG